MTETCLSYSKLSFAHCYTAVNCKKINDIDIINKIEPKGR